ncbi:MAG: hypothetical protein QOJ99_3933 [Bryobacterales bacterium]|jgi:hypothetical protein|nr:hypothetical protein [Bryobacterales bacterium]
MKTRSEFQFIRQAVGCILLVAVAAGLTFAVESAPTLTRAEAKALINKASTPEEHRQLAAYFNHKAEAMEVEAVEHEELAKEYTNHPNALHETKHPMSGNTAGHCRYFAQAARKAAAEDRALATAHENMARTAHK